MQRRNFLKSLGIAGAVLSMPPVVSNAQSTLAGNKKDLTNIKLKGKVISNGKGIAGVAVTDGNNITTTDKNGGYELLSNSTAEFV